MIHPDNLGRFQYYEPSENSNKFWSIRYIKPNTYETMHGRVGNKAVTNTIDEAKARERIKDKLRKGYEQVASNADDEHRKMWKIITQKHLENILPVKDEPQAKKVKL